METTTRTSHIARQKRRFTSNENRIKMALGLSDFEYRNFELETGCKFLEELYPKDQGYGEYYEKFAYDSIFWDWWHLEWKNKEAEYLEFLDQEWISLCQEGYYISMRDLLLNNIRIDHSFHTNYLKHVQQIFS